MKRFFSFKSPLSERLITDEERSDALFSPEKYHPEYNVFETSDAGVKSLAFSFVCVPMVGSDDDSYQQLSSLIGENFPAGTILQFFLYRSPDINYEMFRMKDIRKSFHHPVLNTITDQRQRFFVDHVERPFIIQNKGAHNMGTIYDLKLYVSLKLPLSRETPNVTDFEDAIRWKDKLFSTLSSLHLAPTVLTDDGWLRVMSTIFNWGDQSSWRADNVAVDPLLPLKSQVLDYDTDIEKMSDGVLRISGEKYFKLLSSKRNPPRMRFGEAQHFAGDLFGKAGGLRTNYFVSVNIHFPQADKTTQEFSRRRAMVISQAQKYKMLAPVLIDKEKDLTDIVMSLQNGHRPVQISFHVGVFANSAKAVKDAAVVVRNHWRTKRFDLHEDNNATIPIFRNTLPLCAELSAIQFLKRYKPMTSEQAVMLIPINGEWKGTGTPHMSLISRNTQLMSVSLDDTNSNMNAIISAASGMGKSVYANELATAYLTQGSRVWIIDKGNSYRKICELYSGMFLSFDSSSNPVFAPFGNIISIDATYATTPPEFRHIPESKLDPQGDALLSIFMSMASFSDPLTDLQVSVLQRIIRDVWCTHWRNSTVDHVYQACLENEEKSVQDMGKQMFHFTSNGDYGRYFGKETNVQFDNQFVVLELEHLNKIPRLQQVVMLLMMMQIDASIYLNEEKSRSIVIADEAWDLLKKPTTARFMEYAYRQFRKYNASFVLITQSINDLYQSPIGQAIVENSAFKFILGQYPDVIDNLKKAERLSLTEYEWDILKTVHTQQGVYSEVLLLTPNGNGVGRLVLSSFTALMYSTKAVDVLATKKYQDAGYNIGESVLMVLKDRGIAA